MAKQSGYLRQLEAQRAVREEHVRRFTLQQSKDMLCITMHEDFGWGPDRLQQLLKSWDQTFMAYAQLCLDDAKTDKKLWYTQEKVDERLKSALGEAFKPWEERYKC